MVNNNIQYWLLLTMCQTVCKALQIHYLIYCDVVSTIISAFYRIENWDLVKLNIHDYTRF